MMSVLVKDILYPKLYMDTEKDFQNLKYRVERNAAEWDFCLGAGVSLSCGLPDWRKLLAIMMGIGLRSMEDDNPGYFNDMTSHMREVEKENIREQLRTATQKDYLYRYWGIDLLELAEYVHNDIRQRVQCETGKRKDNPPILPEVERTLIDKYIIEYIKSFFSIELDKPTVSDQFVDSTLYAVVQVMVRRKMKRVLTYNYDNLLEIALRDMGKTVRSYVPEERQEYCCSMEDDVRVFHCHGRIPVKLRKKTPDLLIRSSSTEKESQSIILTEASYLEEDKNIYSLSHVLQSYVVDYRNLIFVGFSGADYTFRTIINSIPQINSLNLYIFFCIDDIVTDVVGDGEKRDNFLEALKRKDSAVEYKRFLINNLVRLKTQYWKNKGMKVIWTSKDEIAMKLKQL